MLGLPGGTFDLPGIGAVPKAAVIGVGAVAAGYVGWRYYQAAGSTADDGATEDAGLSDFADGSGTDGGTIPSVAGAVSDGNLYGDGTTAGDVTQDPGSTDSYGFTGTTNAQWVQYATAQLSTYDPGAVQTALGNYLTGTPLSTAQQAIVNAAIGVAGYPPVGTHTPVVTGGDTPLTVAPTGLSVATTATTATLTFAPVAGAASYRAYNDHSATNVGSAAGTSITVGGLKSGTSYKWHVRAVTASGGLGPSSATVTKATADVKLATPGAPKVSAITTSAAHLTTGAVKGADGYNWYINGTAHGHSDSPAYTVTGLKSKTTYTATVAADTSTQGPGSRSAATKFKTK